MNQWLFLIREGSGLTVDSTSESQVPGLLKCSHKSCAVTYSCVVLKDSPPSQEILTAKRHQGAEDVSSQHPNHQDKVKL
jgi:hypothetical protein